MLEHAKGRLSSMQGTQRRTPAEIIDLSIGHPGPTLLPLEVLKDAAAERLAKNDASLLQYGLEQGDNQFREALAAFLTAAYATDTSAESLFVSSGASQALDLICTRFTRPGDVIFVEEPSYFLALRIFADHGLTTVAIPLEPDGLDMAALEAALKRYTPVFLYSIPTFQNPSGITLSDRKRQQLLELAERHHFLVVADEVYHLLNYSNERFKPLAAYGSEQVLSLGSFSKILAPGLRVGWLQAHPKHLELLNNSGLLLSGGGLNPFTSAIVQTVLANNWQTEHLNTLRKVYSERLEVLSDALMGLPNVSFTKPKGGYFVWLELAHGSDADLLHKAEKYKLAFQSGTKFSSMKGLQAYIRLSFSYYPPADLRAGVQRLAALLEELKETL